jgi:hypothetical protein
MVFVNLKSFVLKRVRFIEKNTCKRIIAKIGGKWSFVNRGILCISKVDCTLKKTYLKFRV